MPAEQRKLGFSRRTACRIAQTGCRKDANPGTVNRRTGLTPERMEGADSARPGFRRLSDIPARMNTEPLAALLADPLFRHRYRTGFPVLRLASSGHLRQAEVEYWKSAQRQRRLAVEHQHRSAALGLLISAIP